MRFVGSAGSVIVNPDGSYGLFLSGGWAADGDSDSFNQILYTTSTNGEYWTVPTPVISTDYSFAASATQDSQVAGGHDDPLGISAYYSGRAYAPSVVQNPDGTLTMLFAGDRVPKSIATAGSPLGTDSSALYTPSPQDPALYRNILAVTLNSSTSPTVTTQTSLAESPSAPVVGETVTGTATVSVPLPGAGTPTGTVTFYTCGESVVPCTPSSASRTQLGSPVTVTPGAANTSTAISSSFTPTSAGTWCFAAVYSGDSNYAGSSDESSDGCYTVGQLTSSTVSSPSSSTAALGGTNTDGATVTGSDADVDPTGTVTFYECGPTASATPCTSSSWTQFDTESLSGSANPDTVTSASFTPSATGTWCFAAVYGGDGNYTGSSDGSTDECFTVGSAGSSTTSTPTNSSITLGGTNTDGATVTGSDADVDPTGTVNFYECGPTASATPCTSSSWTQFDTESLSGSANPDTVTSASFTPSATGTWCFAAVYGGDGNYTGSSDGNTDECFTVTGTAPSVTTQPQSQYYNSGQSLTFTAGASGNPTPTVQWQYSTNGGSSWSNLSGATSTTLTVGPLTNFENGWEVRAVFTNSVSSATSNAATMTLATGPSVTTQPVSQYYNSGQSLTFTAGASGNPTPTVQWQYSTNGGSSWSNLSGATSTPSPSGRSPTSRTAGRSGPCSPTRPARPRATPPP